MADAKKGGKGSKKLGRAARQQSHNKGVRLHKIAHARERHLKNAFRSCGKDFADKLQKYYSSHPVNMVGRRAGTHKDDV